MLKLVSDALVYKHFVFIDKTICSNNSKKLIGKSPNDYYAGSFVIINGVIYQLRGKGFTLYFEICTENDIRRAKITRKAIVNRLTPNETIAVMVYSGKKSACFEYTLPSVITPKIYVL